MVSNKLILWLVVATILMISVLGFLFWKLQNPYSITTASEVSGIKLAVNNKKDLYDFLNRVKLWQRTTWSAGVEGATQGKQVNSLKVIYTDKYLWFLKGPDDPKDFSSSMEIIGDQLVLKIQVAARGDQGKAAFQTEFIRVLTPILEYTEKDLMGFLTLYKDKPFFKLNL